MNKPLSLVLVCIGLLVCASSAPAATIVVNTDTDPNPALNNDGLCTLREAIVASNTDTPSGATVGECATGSGADTIDFDDAIFVGPTSPSPSTIDLSVSSDLPPMTQPVTVDGENCGSPAPCVGIDANNSSGLSVTAANSAVNGVAVFDADGPFSVAIRGDGDNFVIRNTWLGMSLNQTAASNTAGILISGDNNTIGGTGVNDRNVIAATQTAAVRIVGSANTTVQGNYMGTKANGFTIAGVGNFNGVQVVGDTAIPVPAPVGTVIGGPEAGVPGACEAPCNVIANNVSSDITLASSGGTAIPAGQTTIEGNFVGISATGTDLGTGGIEVGNADDVTVGGDASRRNYVTTEIHADTGATGFDAVANFVGLNPAGTARFDDSATIRIGTQGSPITGASVIGNRVARLNSGGAGAAIDLAAASSIVRGNVIGIGIGGENVGGGTTGIFVNGGSANQIGGSDVGEGNVIGNAGTAVLVGGSGSTYAGNVIGTDATETQAHPVTLNGILLNGGSSNVVGGTTAASENVINNVPDDAIRVSGNNNDFNRILRNRGTAAVGHEFVDLGAIGPGNGGGNGPNQDIERPTITAGATSEQVSGTGALAGATVRVFRTASTTPPATGPRDVIAYVGQATANGSGAWTLNCPSAGCEVGLPGAGQVTANQTSTTGNSSEMAAPEPYADLPPDTQIDSGPAGGSTTGDSTPTFGFSASEPGATFTCSIDGGAFAACGGPGATHTPAPLGDGLHSFSVRASDGVNPPDTTPASRTFTVDATPPQTQVESGPAAGSTTADSTPTFGFSANEGGSTFQCKVDGESFAACSGPGAGHTPAALADGQHTFEVRATDSVGNVDGSPATRTFTVDATAPETSLDAGGPPAGGTTADSTPSFGFSANEGGSTFECRIDNDAFGACSGPGSEHTAGALADGQHTFEVRATDAVGNADASPASRAFTVDTTAPDAQIDSGPAAGSTTSDSTPSFGFSSNDAGATFECRVDGGDFLACSGPGSAHTPAALGNGQHTFEVRATDAVGNVDQTPVGRTFTIDADPPETTIDKTPKRKSFKRKAKFAFSSDEAGASFECKLDKGQFARCDTSAKFKVKPGKHTLEVRATDAVGNTDQTPAIAKWKVKKRK